MRLEDKCIKESEDVFTYFLKISKNQILPGEYTDLKKNETYGKAMVDDFGDYIPFLYWLGMITKKNKYKKEAIRLSKTIINLFQMPNGLFVTNVDSIHKKIKKSNLCIFDADKMSDLSLGLNLMFELTKDPYYANSAMKFFGGLAENQLLKNSQVAYKYCCGIKVPFSSGKFSGLYIEELARLYNFTKKQHYLVLANKLAQPWISSPFFKKYGLFEFSCTSKLAKPFIGAFLKKTNNISLDLVMSSKSNSNLVFGLVELYNVGKDPKVALALERWVDSIEKYMLHKEGVFYSFWNYKKDIPSKVFLACDHAVIDCLIGIYFATNNKKALGLAKKCIDAWLKHKHSYLMPQSIPNTSASYLKSLKYIKNPSISRLDLQTDFGVVLLKMYEITKDKSYLEHAESIIDAVLKYHKFGNGFVDFVDTKSLKIIPYYIIETKFLGLLPKLLLLYHHVKQGKRIYEDNLIQNIIRDR